MTVTTMYCNECGKVLTRSMDRDGVTWIHSASEAVFGYDDHEPAPVESTPKKDERCDFCNCSDPEWIIPQAVETKTSYAMIDTKNLGRSRTLDLMDEEWAACSECRERVENATDPTELAEWVLDHMVDTFPVPPRGPERASLTRNLSGMYANLLDNRLPTVSIKDYDK